MSVLGLNSKDTKSTRDKANISNPKVNRGCAPLTANRISADRVHISLGPSIPYFHWVSTILGDSTLWLACKRLGLLYLYILGWRCQTANPHHIDEILGCCTPVRPSTRLSLSIQTYVHEFDTPVTGRIMVWHCCLSFCVYVSLQTWFLSPPPFPKE